MKHLILFFILFCLPLTATAQNSATLYDVHNVVVDITADNAVNARNQAFGKAQNQAFAQLMQQLKQPDTTKAPDDITLGRMVKDFEIASEHVASNRYRGNFIFRFDPAQVDAFLGSATIATPAVSTSTEALPIIAPPPASNGRSVALIIPFDTLLQWRQIQMKLQQTGLVSKITIYAMQYKQAEVRAMLLGSLPELQARLRQDGYTLDAKGPDTYLLRQGR